MPNNSEMFNNPLDGMRDVPADTERVVHLIWQLNGELISTFIISRSSSCFDGEPGPVQKKEHFFWVTPDYLVLPTGNPLRIYALSWTGIPLRQEQAATCEICKLEHNRIRRIGKYMDGLPGTVTDAQGNPNWLCQPCYAENTTRILNGSSWRGLFKTYAIY